MWRAGCIAPGRVEPIPGLAARWRGARRAALNAVLQEAGAADDTVLLAEALARDRDQAQRRVFENSLRLGQGFARFHHTALTLETLPDALDQVSGVAAPCLRGTWTAVPDEAALRLERPGCPFRDQGPAACDWWREAISGLVLGVAAGLRHARHQSCGHGDGRCVDIIYVHPESPLRFGPIPAEMADALAAVARMVTAFDTSAAVAFLGLSEGVLYYQLIKPGCGTVRAQPLVEQGVHRRFPDLALREVSPRPVLLDP